MVTKSEQRGEVYRLIRQRARLSQKDFGELVGCSQSTIHHLESGKRPLTSNEADVWSRDRRLGEPSFDLLMRPWHVPDEVRKLKKEVELRSKDANVREYERQWKAARRQVERLLEAQEALGGVPPRALEDLLHEAAVSMLNRNSSRRVGGALEGAERFVRPKFEDVHVVGPAALRRLDAPIEGLARDYLLEAQWAKDEAAGASGGFEPF